MRADQFVYDIIVRGNGFNWNDLIKVWRDSNTKLSFKKWFKKHLMTEYLMSSYMATKVIDHFSKEIDNLDLNNKF